MNLLDRLTWLLVSHCFDLFNIFVAQKIATAQEIPQRQRLYTFAAVKCH